MPIATSMLRTFSILLYQMPPTSFSSPAPLPRPYIPYLVRQRGNPVIRHLPPPTSTDTALLAPPTPQQTHGDTYFTATTRLPALCLLLSALLKKKGFQVMKQTCRGRYFGSLNKLLEWRIVRSLRGFFQSDKHYQRKGTSNRRLYSV